MAPPAQIPIILRQQKDSALGLFASTAWRSGRDAGPPSQVRTVGWHMPGRNVPDDAGADQRTWPGRADRIDEAARRPAAAWRRGA
ncbi:hypothetical protein HMPREF9057_01457 [Actinomyces sp. oral taxon 171 str. F0337]|nr:hypothetical protein HMPREF9057_01457 [Actinomyces sp. oral taxon 171 str. F0337]